MLRAAARDLVRSSAVLACTLVDAGSGMLLDAHVTGRVPGGTDELENLAAAQVELVRAAEDVRARAAWAGAPSEIVMAQGSGLFHLVRALPDPYGDGLVLAVLVAAPERNLRRVRRKLDRIDPGALVPRRPVAPPTPVPPGPAPASGTSSEPSVPQVPAAPLPRRRPGGSGAGVVAAQPFAGGPRPVGPAPVGPAAVVADQLHDP
ncbi:MAG: hypothetical protein OJJ54_01210, partial [Pseudonocardia sp.]|nr:hypothetical protein [Pseudonocardia sp.]